MGKSYDRCAGSTIVSVVRGSESMGRGQVDVQARQPGWLEGGKRDGGCPGVEVRRRCGDGYHRSKVLKYAVALR